MGEGGGKVAIGLVRGMRRATAPDPGILAGSGGTSRKLLRPRALPWKGSRLFDDGYEYPRRLFRRIWGSNRGWRPRADGARPSPNAPTGHLFERAHIRNIGPAWCTCLSAPART